MSQTNAMLELSSSLIQSSSTMLQTKDTLGEGHFRWSSIKQFVYFACTFAASAYNFDIFSKVCENVRLVDFILSEMTLGIAYMCMDSFIKLYTKRFDCNKFMNPLLRGISYGRFLQTSLFVVLHSSYLADSLKFLLASFQDVPPWSICQKENGCISAKDIMVRCNRNLTTNFTLTSAYFHYQATFGALDRNTLTTRVFVLGLVWMLVFFFATVTEETVVKIFRLAFLCTSISTLVVIGFIFVSTNNIATEAFSQIVDVSTPSELMLSVKYVAYTFGIGFLGLYDFGAMSAYTMVDTASVIYVAVFTSLAFMRSWIVKILYLVTLKCVNIPLGKYGTHILFYAILPLTTEFLYAHKLYLFYFYGNVVFGTLVYMTNLMIILAKFLSYEFRAIKNIYVIGLLCSIGFAGSIPLLALMTTMHRARAFTAGLDVLVPYLGGAYVAIVMWLYGLKKFCTDVQFWLGFRPTRFWTITWAIVPVALFLCSIRNAYLLAQWDRNLMWWCAVGWIGFTMFIVAAIQIKTMSGFLMRNNLAGIFKSHRNYGPPEVEDRRRRLYYSEFTRQRKCKHNCLVIDEWFECNHQTLIIDPDSIGLSSSSSDTSLMNIYDAKTTSRLRSVGVLSQNLASTHR
ncbi:sodium-dependent nutrient amino acid transporter 1-like isoform X1 [Helicoverpa zea]|uniref:sodium-dependent nutrient amino acid transporter 1-like isoform X1 n=1 Tax=Helicoverpa zea TaxID=7113 RepID=UPI001F5A6E69|nr:sodium-dependent nutrient amino acid transporter 1-like isoform X1 [Helicoverpa zea]